MGLLTEIWRHPIKSHGREQLSRILLSEGKCLPWDRRWAVAHEMAKFDTDNPGWVPCSNFSRGAKAPQLMAITAQADMTKQELTLSHPKLRDLTFDPEISGDVLSFIQWVMRISPTNRALPSDIVRVPQRGMTDTDFPSVSLINMASHHAVSKELDHEISHLRWRGNLILEGLRPWEEFDWIGRTIRVGLAEIEIREKITRCLATTANPDTGERDADTLGALKSGWDHQEFGVYGVVTKTGDIEQGDTVEVI